MARERKKPDDKIPPPGEWMVTFSDCMTLLLCFFVLLLTFSSFEEVEKQKIGGVFSCMVNSSIFPRTRDAKESAVPPIDRGANAAPEGSEMPTQLQEPDGKFPGKLPPILDDDAFKDKRVLYVPADLLFWGQGTVLTAEGQKYLEGIGSFLAALPSRVILGESGPGRGGPEARMDRALVVMDQLIRRAKLPAERFSVSASPTSVPGRLRGRAVITVTLVLKELY